MDPTPRAMAAVGGGGGKARVEGRVDRAWGPLGHTAASATEAPKTLANPAWRGRAAVRRGGATEPGPRPPPASPGTAPAAAPAADGE
jgi:hypothetical protein